MLIALMLIDLISWYLYVVRAIDFYVSTYITHRYTKKPIITHGCKIVIFESDQNLHLISYFYHAMKPTVSNSLVQIIPLQFIRFRFTVNDEQYNLRINTVDQSYRLRNWRGKYIYSRIILRDLSFDRMIDRHQEIFDFALKAR